MFSILLRSIDISKNHSGFLQKKAGAIMRFKQ